MPQADWKAWIRINTAGCRSVLDLGAGFCEKLGLVDPAVTERIAIEIFAPSIDAATFTNCERICGDMRDWRRLLAGREIDTVLMVDALEHLTKPDALILIAELQQAARRILVLSPRGLHVQNGDRSGAGNEAQIHRSAWRETELAALGFSVSVDPFFYSPKHLNRGFMFCRWDRRHAE